MVACAVHAPGQNVAPRADAEGEDHCSGAGDSTRPRGQRGAANGASSVEWCPPDSARRCSISHRRISISLRHVSGENQILAASNPRPNRCQRSGDEVARVTWIGFPINVVVIHCADHVAIGNCRIPGRLDPETNAVAFFIRRPWRSR